ncbi:MAG: AAA family ATPase [Planctomycetes bacterium]|nr:AAA family ATPase [Planctomycetota bacterium]
MRTIAVLNQKGGVGKTTSVVNIAAALAAAGSRVVVLDFDPQAHLTIHLGLEPQVIESGSYKVLTQSAEFEQQIMLMRPNLWLLPANINLVGAESELVSVVGRETILREAMMSSQDKFDYCLIDCSPSLGLLTLNALAASDDVLIPLQPHFLALRGFGKLLQTVELVNKRINPDLKVQWVLLCMFDGRASLPNEVKDDIAQFLESAQGTDCPWSGAQILPVHIRRNIKLAEAPSYGKTIFEYEENCHGAEDYRKVAELIHAQCYPSAIKEKLQPVAVDEMQEQHPTPSATSPQPEPQAEQQPATQPVESQPAATDEIQEQPPAISVPSPQPEPQAEQQPDTQPVVTDEIQEQPPAVSAPSPQPEPQAEQQPDTQPAETDDNQNQAPIEIKSISSEHQPKEDDLNEQPSEFTQTTSEQSES